MARKAKAEEHDNLERWLVSYADFITLLFAFFVVMYSISSINEGKYRVLSDSLIAAFHSPNKTLMPIQVGKVTKSPIKEKMKIKQSPFVIKVPEIPLPWTQDAELKGAGDQRYRSRGPVIDKLLEKLAAHGKLQLSAEQQAALRKALHTGRTVQGTDETAGRDTVVMKKIAADVQRALQALIDKNLIKVRRTKLWVEVEIKDSVLFASGQAEINPKAVHVIRDLAKILAPFPNVVRVEGFTDDVPIANNVYPSNWELSSARADSVVRLMIDHGIQPPRLLAVGYGKYHPIADNSTASGRSKNRRVSLVVLAQGASGLAVDAKPADHRVPADDGTAKAPAGVPMPATEADHRSPAGKAVQAPAPEGPAAPPAAASRGVQPPGGEVAQRAAPVRSVIPPPIQLAPPIRLPLSLGKPGRRPLPRPNDIITGKRP